MKLLSGVRVSNLMHLCRFSFFLKYQSVFTKTLRSLCLLAEPSHPGTQPSVGLSLWLPSYSWLVMARGTWLRAAYSSFNIAHRQAWWKWAELDSGHWILSLGWRPGHLRSPWHFAQLQVEPDESIPCTAGSLTHPDGGSPSTRSLHSTLHKRGIERTDTQCIHSPSSQGSYQLLSHLLRQAVSSKITQYRKYTETYRMCSR